MTKRYNLKDTFARGSHVATEENPDLGLIFATGRSNNPFWRIIILDEKMVGGVNRLTRLVHEMKLKYSVCRMHYDYKSIAFGYVGKVYAKWTLTFEHDDTEDRFLHLKQVKVETEDENGYYNEKKYNAKNHCIIAIDFAKKEFAESSSSL